MRKFLLLLPLRALRMESHVWTPSLLLLFRGAAEGIPKELRSDHRHSMLDLTRPATFGPSSPDQSLYSVIRLETSPPPLPTPLRAGCEKKKRCRHVPYTIDPTSLQPCYVSTCSGRPSSEAPDAMLLRGCADNAPLGHDWALYFKYSNVQFV